MLSGSGLNPFPSLDSVNAVDVLYAAFPMYLYLNPALGGYLLRPLLEGQDNEAYDIPYAAQDLGGSEILKDNS